MKSRFLKQEEIFNLLFNRIYLHQIINLKDNRTFDIFLKHFREIAMNYHLVGNKLKFCTRWSDLWIHCGWSIIPDKFLTLLSVLKSPGGLVIVTNNARVSFQNVPPIKGVTRRNSLSECSRLVKGWSSQIGVKACDWYFLSRYNRELVPMCIRDRCMCTHNR